MSRGEVQDARLKIAGNLAYALIREPAESWEGEVFRHLQRVVVQDCRVSGLPLHLMFPSVGSVHLDIRGNITLEMLNMLPELIEIALWNRTEAWPSLNELRFSGRVTSVQLISESIDWPQMRKLAEIAEVKHLALFAFEGGFLPSLEDISSLQHLESMELGMRTGAFPDLSPLRDCTRLRQVTLSTERSASHILDQTLGFEELQQVKRILVNSGYKESVRPKGLQQLERGLPSCTFEFRSQWLYGNMLEDGGFEAPAQ